MFAWMAWIESPGQELGFRVLDSAGPWHFPVNEQTKWAKHTEYLDPKQVLVLSREPCLFFLWKLKAEEEASWPFIKYEVSADMNPKSEQPWLNWLNPPWELKLDSHAAFDTWSAKLRGPIALTPTQSLQRLVVTFSTMLASKGALQTQTETLNSRSESLYTLKSLF